MSSPSPTSEEPIYPLFSASLTSHNTFVRHLNSSRRILALCGAGLSASAPSNIPTFNGSGALWKNHKAASLSSIEAFEANPGLVWSYFADRRRLACRAEVNEGHKALAALARKKGGFVCLTQNIDGWFPFIAQVCAVCRMVIESAVAWKEREG
jgi:NAD-dependent SIR2 family protein deacetylase